MTLAYQKERMTMGNCVRVLVLSNVDLMKFYAKVNQIVTDVWKMINVL